METTVRVHMNDRPAFGHNSDDTIRKKEPHIKQTDGGYHEVWGPDRSLIQAYEELLGPQLDEYNAKQKRKDRRMTIEQYIQSVEADTRGFQKRKRVNGKLVADTEAKKGKKPMYEFVVSVGDTTKGRDSDGHIDYDDYGRSVRPYEVPPEVNEMACRRYYEDFERRNPNMKIVRADYHADEGWVNQGGVWEWGTEHLHLSFIPFADGFARGVSRQNSMNKALAAMGYTGSDAYDKWWAAERAVMEQYAKEAYADYCRDNPDYAKENGPTLEIVHPIADGERPGENIVTETYRAIQDLQEQLDDKNLELDYLLQDCRGFREEKERLVKERESLQGWVSLLYECIDDLDGPDGAIEDLLGRYNRVDGKLHSEYCKALREPPRDVSGDVWKGDVAFLKSKSRIDNQTGQRVTLYDDLMADRERRAQESAAELERKQKRRAVESGQAQRKVDGIKRRMAPLIPQDEAERKRLVDMEMWRRWDEDWKRKDEDDGPDF